MHIRAMAYHALAFALLASGCGSSVQLDTARVKSREELDAAYRKASLSAALRLIGDPHVVGDTLSFELSMTNQSADSIVTMAESANLYDLTLLRNGEVVYQWSKGKPHGRTQARKVIRSKETRRDIVEWHGFDNLHGAPPSGTYRAFGIYYVQPYLYTDTLTFELLPATK